ncbi:MAG: Ig-like domain-containing protein [Clostridia bacterium]|nr:Ig-like domain-containing protein [Clostridia bacterium]
MKKICKKSLLSLFLALCFILSFGMMVACDEDTEKPGGLDGTDDEPPYTVTVLKDDGTPANGVKVNVLKGRTRLSSGTTDDNGKTEFDLAPDSYTVELDTMPERFRMPDNANLSLTEEKRDLTVTLEKFGYMVKLVHPDDTPYYREDVSVAICELGSTLCNDYVTLGNDGVAFFDYPTNSYHVKLLGLPEDAKYELDKDDFYAGENFSPTNRDLKIVISTSLHLNIALTTKMTAEEKTAYASNHKSYNETIRQYDAYKFTTEVAAKGTASFSFTPEVTGIYYIFTDSKLHYTNKQVASGYLSSTIICKAGEVFTIAAENYDNSPTTAEFVIAAPFSSFVEHKGLGGDVSLRVGRANTFAVIEFTPNTGAVYTATVQGSASAYVTSSTSHPDELANSIPDENYQTNASAKGATPYGISTPIYFAVAVKADEYPVNVTLKIEQGALSTYEYATVQEELSQAIKPEGTLHGIPMDGTSTEKLTYDEDAKAYRFGTDTNAPIVYVKLTKALDEDRFSSGCSLAYIELTSVYIATYTADSEKEDGSILTTDYSKFLRGFTRDKYKITQNMQNTIYSMPDPKDIEDGEYYAKYVNEDGAYPLTQELKEFLEAFYQTNKGNILNQTEIKATNQKAKDAWLFPCYYYA